MENISFHYEYNNFTIEKEDLVKDWILFLIRHHGGSPGEVNYIFLSDEDLWQMNKKYLGHDYYTDILTFPTGDSDELIQGDIYVSVERVEDNAKTFEQDFHDELHRVIIHGVLHLLGFEDHGPEEKTMRKKEEEALNLRTF